MKIMINYDLLDKIRESKTGISLHRSSKVVLITSGIATIITMIILATLIPLKEVSKHLIQIIVQSLLQQTLIRTSFDLLVSKAYKIISKDQLRQLSSQLKDININTDKDLILDSYKYKTEYKWAKSDNDIDLIQKKYIMVPVIENGEEKEVSILQEHAIGSKTYSLSIGEPTKQKVFKLALNSM